MRYQNAYVWLVLVSALDVILTALVLYVWQGDEVNPVAETIIRQKGFGWIVAFKLGMCVLVVVICEVVGRRDDRLGRQLAIVAVVINAFPVAFTFVLLRQAGPIPGLEGGPAEVAAIGRLVEYLT